jgi:hypothetical protein
MYYREEDCLNIIVADDQASEVDDELFDKR